MKATYRVHDYKSAARPKLRSVVAWNDIDGKRQRKYFESKKEAETFAQQRETELKNQGREALGFPTALRVMAQECHDLLSPHGHTIADATRAFLKNLRLNKARREISAAAADFYQSRAAYGVKRKTLNYLRMQIRSLVGCFTGKLVSEVSADDVRDYIEMRKNAGVQTVISRLIFFTSFLNWCKRRGYCDTNVAELVEKPRSVEVPVGILKPEELSRLLAAADPYMLAYIAIGAFAGIRGAELMRLDWSEINLDDGLIEITAQKSKTARRRLVKILPVLSAWLKPLAKPSGKVVPWESIWGQLMLLCKKAGLAIWPKNALRHSFATYHLAQFKNAAELALEMGHTGTALIFRHYRAVVRDAQAAAYWQLFPAQPERVAELAAANLKAEPWKTKTWKRGCDGKRVRNFATSYLKTAKEYCADHGVKIHTMNKWIRLGMPLDDPAAMAKLKDRKYACTRTEYAERYGVGMNQVATWQRAGWPLDNVAGFTGYLRMRRTNALSRFPGPANQVLHVLPFPESLQPLPALHDGSSKRQAS